MSSSAQPAEPVPKADRERKGIVKVFAKVKGVLRRTGTERQPSAAARSGAVATAATTPGTKTEDAPKLISHVDAKAAEARALYEAMPGVSRLSKLELFEERAKKLNERFGLEIHPMEWQSAIPSDTVLRMDKPIRMRIRRTCHRCNATFGATKECPNCSHSRCTKCTRYPPKRSEAEIVASRERRAAQIKANRENAPILPDYAPIEKEIVLKRPSKTGGQDLIHKKPRQRVRRTCHECDTLFTAGTKTCEKCKHVRCTDCPRDPPKKDKYPFGYPGDAFGPKSVPHYECLNCKTVYPTGVEDGTECRKCKFPKSHASPRALPRKVEPTPDPEVIRRLQSKLDGLNLT
ncbi:hypothetical protein TGAM01_v207516 [Trichoderma gamsii]|uniref:Uncharacterized protein n=1 Tax=Trichoderma gamsii TaxID=398673 RepID=A0A2K0T8C0_9HYPO|nr:hypothetical protein TGAM01_v207516 [Trichoderma gamsii]PNP41776.1 hypothetical protein TGAMA5MH_06369 [Trichoderma gamsii]PON23572.1 hypothetical protein TGAM01_v207516 [Trichoderma gamsii]